MFSAIFDWDGVIIDSSELHEESWEMLCTEISKQLPPDSFRQNFGKKSEVIISDLGWASDPEEIRRLGLRKETLYRELVQKRGVHVLPGVQSLLQSLNGAGIPCAVGSSTHRENIDLVFALTGLGSFFRAVVTGEDVSQGKPDPEVFLKAAERLGMLPAQSVVFEDALVGVEAAKRAGMSVIAVATTYPLEALQDADLAVTSLEEIDLTRLTALLSHR